jgi:CheY-like chemotaxis protein
VNRRILAKRLSLCGHTVVNTTNGQEGLDKVKEDQDFDCIFMDLQYVLLFHHRPPCLTRLSYYRMPIMDGYEATEGIRKLEGAIAFVSTRPSPRRLSHKLNGRIPIFAVSASLIEQQRAELRELGMDGWILKPIDFKRLDVILKGVTDASQRGLDVYRPGCSWEIGGWFTNVTGSST